MSLVGRKYSQALLEVAKEKGKTDEIYNQFSLSLKLWTAKKKCGKS